MRAKLRLLSTKPSEPQRNKNRFRFTNAVKQPTQNTAAEKRERCPGKVFDYLYARKFGALRSINRIRRTVRPMSTESQRTCPSCGNELSGAMEFCPVCMLRGALPGAAKSGASSFEETIKPTPEQAT